MSNCNSPIQFNLDLFDSIATTEVTDQPQESPADVTSENRRSIKKNLLGTEIVDHSKI
jgi:hypothetical protein